MRLHYIPACLWLLSMLIPMSTYAAARGAAPSFPCSAAKGRIETTICANPALVDADVKLADAYRAALPRIPTADVPAFRQNQRNWLAGRGKECEGQDDDYADCLSWSYASRLSTLQSVAQSPQSGLTNLLWTDGVVCSGSRALIRFAHRGMDDDNMSNDPPSIGGELARAVASPSQCKLADGRMIRFKTASLNDEQAHGQCGAGNTELYSVWIGDDKIISREERAGKCDANPVRAIFLDGHHLTQCVENKGAFDVKAESRSCKDISARLRKPIHDKLPSGQLLITYAATGMHGFCKGLIHSDAPDEVGREWPPKTASPSDGMRLTGTMFDLNNSGRSQNVIRIEGANHFFDGSFFMIPPRSMSTTAMNSVVAKQSDEPDPAAARKFGFQVFSGDQTPYQEPRYVRYTAFRKDGATWLYATWAVNRLDLPTEIITKPQSNGTQKLICSYQATPNL